MIKIQNKTIFMIIIIQIIALSFVSATIEIGQSGNSNIATSDNLTVTGHAEIGTLTATYGYFTYPTLIDVTATNITMSDTFSDGTMTISGGDITGVDDINSTEAYLTNGVYVDDTKVTNGFTVTVCNKKVCNYITDGIDDDVQIQQAYDYAGTLPNGATVKILAGIYNLSNQLIFNQTLPDKAVNVIGEGEQVTILNFPNSSGIYVHTWGSDDGYKTVFGHFEIRGNPTLIVDDTVGLRVDFCGSTIFEYIKISYFDRSLYTTRDVINNYKYIYERNNNQGLLAIGTGANQYLKISDYTLQGDNASINNYKAVELTSFDIEGFDLTLDNIDALTYVGGWVEADASIILKNTIDALILNPANHGSMELINTDNSIFIGNFRSMTKNITIDENSSKNLFIYGANLSKIIDNGIGTMILASDSISGDFDLTGFGDLDGRGQRLINWSNFYNFNDDKLLLDFSFSDLNKVNDTLIVDSSVNKYTGTLIEEPEWTETGGVDNTGAYIFNRSNYISTNMNINETLFNKNFTISLWANGQRDNTGLIGASSSTPRFYIRVETDAGGLSALRVGMGTSTGVSSGRYYTTTGWNFITLVYDPEIGTKYYHNGRYKETLINNINQSLPEIDMIIGSIDTVSTRFDGIIDEVNIITRKRSDDEILNMYESKKTGSTSYGYSAKNNIWYGDNTFTANLEVSQTSTTGETIYAYRNLASALTDSPVMFIEQDNNGDNQPALTVQNDGTGNGLYIDQNGAGNAINIEAANSANTPIFVGNMNSGNAYMSFGDYLGTDGTYYFNRNLGSANTGSAVMFIEQDNAGDDQPALKIQQDGTAPHIVLTATTAVTTCVSGGLTYNTTGFFGCHEGTWKILHTP